MDRFQDGNARLTAAAAATGAIAAVARTRPHRAIPRRGSRCAASGPRGTNAAPLGTSRGSDNARQLAGSRTCARHRPDLLHTARRVVLTGSFLSLPLSLSLSLSLLDSGGRFWSAPHGGRSLRCCRTTTAQARAWSSSLPSTASSVRSRARCPCTRCARPSCSGASPRPAPRR
jgi:hypothetical protein